MPILLRALDRRDVEDCKNVSNLVRKLALDLGKEHGKLNLSRQLLQMLQKMFAGVSEVSTTIDEDTKSIDKLAQQHACQMQVSKQFEITKNQVEKLRAAANSNKPDSNSRSDG